MNHDLKTWPVFFRSILDGTKTFEIRKRDRNFVVGDLVTLREYVPARNLYTDRTVTVRITYLMGEESTIEALKPGWCVFGFERVPDASDVTPEKPREPMPEPEGTRLRCTVQNVTPVALTVEDERGETHVLTGPSYRAETLPGMVGTITMRPHGWDFDPRQP